jgi:dephospho-CoA kinase
MCLPESSLPVIGVVGGVGSGKSLAAQCLTELGCALIDADKLGHEVLQEDQVVAAVRQRWGDDVLTRTGQVDRRALGEIVFADPAELAVLSEITWPCIGRRIRERIDEHVRRRDVPAVVLDAAVLFEAGWNTMCTHTVFVDAPEDLRLRRVLDRGWSEGVWRKREKSQISLDAKRRRCYATVDNSSSLAHLRTQIRRLFSRIVSCPDGL